MIMDNRQNYFPMNTPSYNQISSDDSLAVQAAKRAAQDRQIQSAPFANWAVQTPILQQPQSEVNNQNYNAWNAMSDILDAYWKNRAAQDSQGQPVSGNSVSDVLGALSNVGASSTNRMPEALRGKMGDAQPILNTSGQFFPNTDYSFADWTKR